MTDIVEQINDRLEAIMDSNNLSVFRAAKEEITTLRKELADARAENERLLGGLERLAEADARSTNSGSAQEAFAFVHAVAETLLETMHPRKAKGETV